MFSIQSVVFYIIIHFSLCGDNCKCLSLTLYWRKLNCLYTEIVNPLNNRKVEFEFGKMQKVHCINVNKSYTVAHVRCK